MLALQAATERARVLLNSLSHCCISPRAFGEDKLRELLREAGLREIAGSLRVVANQFHA